jgi:TRAP-type mannitol/chloroaromatic compound transport system substrate-binding protein
VNHYSDMFNSVISFGLVINDKSYAGLPKEYQALIDGLGTKESAVAMSKMSWSDFPKFVEYNKTMELKRVKVSPDADKQMRAVAVRVVNKRIAEMEKKGLPATKVYGEIKALAAQYSK